MVKSSVALLLGAFAGIQACTAPKANEATVQFVAGYEGWRDYVYADPGNGFPTLGYGHLCKKPNCAEVPYKFPPLSKADGLKLLSSDMAVAENCVYQDTNDKVVLNANQYGALVSWAFNVGCGNVAKSDLIKRLNRGEDPNTVAANELPQWDHDAKGHVLQGLKNRRAAEVNLFKTPSNEPALPACMNPPPPPPQSSSKPPPPPASSTEKPPTSSSTAPPVNHSSSEHHHTPTISKTRTGSKPTHTNTKSKPTSHHHHSTMSTATTATTAGSSWISNSTTSAPMMTSTVYTTTVHTITSCHSTVTNCPAHSTVVITETVPAYTTVCPVTEIATVQPVPTCEGECPGGPSEVPSVPTASGGAPTGPGGPSPSGAGPTCEGDCPGGSNPTGGAPTGPGVQQPTTMAPPPAGGNSTQPTSPPVLGGAVRASFGGAAIVGALVLLV